MAYLSNKLWAVCLHNLLFMSKWQVDLANPISSPLEQLQHNMAQTNNQAQQLCKEPQNSSVKDEVVLLIKAWWLWHWLRPVVGVRPVSTMWCELGFAFVMSPHILCTGCRRWVFPHKKQMHRCPGKETPNETQLFETSSMCASCVANMGFVFSSWSCYSCWIWVQAMNCMRIKAHCLIFLNMVLTLTTHWLFGNKPQSWPCGWTTLMRLGVFFGFGDNESILFGSKSCFHVKR